MLEIIVENLEDALAAEAGGATLLDLKSNFVGGGFTPTAGMVEMICSRVNTDVVVLVRSQVKSLILSSEDISIMCADIKLSAERGASGFLLGAINEQGTIDDYAVEKFKEAANGLPLHFNLAWEVTEDPRRALDDLIRLGVKTARTSGGQGAGGKAIDRIDDIRSFKEQSAGQITLLLSGGVNCSNITPLVRGTGVMHAHAGSGVRQPANPKGILGEEKVRELRETFNKAISSYAL